MAGTARELAFVTLLTIARFPLILLFFVGALINASAPSPALFLASCAALAASAITDMFDGALARRYHVETHFGAHADPLMDKFFYLATLPLLVYVTLHKGHTVHAIALLIMTLMFLTRDQWVTFLRSIGSIYQVSGKAHWAGKLRTAINFPLIGLIYVFEASPWPLNRNWFFLLHAAEVVAVLINFISLYTYTRSYWPYLRKAASLHSQKDKLA